jgi:hypothetical protein
VIGDCAFELTWLAAVTGDREDARTMIDHALAVAPPDVEGIGLARAYKLLVDGDAAAAQVAIGKLESVIAADAPWWKVVGGYDVAVGAALADEAAGQRAGALHHLERAAQLLARAATSLPPGPLHRRQRTLETIRARLR